MKAPSEPINYLWWLVSRASAIVALILISVSVLIGLAMSTKVIGRPGLKRNLARLHEHVALTALVAIGAHGLSLLGDHWLRPGWSGIAIPFAMSYRPQFTGAGIIGGYIAALLGPSFYLRRRIGTRRWRRLHTLVVLAWVMSVAHTLGAGSDAHQAWLQALVVAPSIPIVYLLVMRILRYDARAPRRGAAQRGYPSHLTHGATAQLPDGGGATDRRAERHRPDQSRSESAAPILLCFDGSEDAANAIAAAGRLLSPANAVALHAERPVLIVPHQSGDRAQRE